MTDLLAPDKTVTARAAITALRRDGRSPKQIARALGLRPSVVSEVVRALARQRDAGDPSPDGGGGSEARGWPLAGCWVNRNWANRLSVDGHPEWPRGDGEPRGCDGLATVVVARAL